MTIIPDTKDWTWVLRRPCPECGLDTQGFSREAVPEMIMTSAEAWQDLLTGPGDTRTRPVPGRWSALEYGCHVRDVFRLFDERLDMMLSSRGPAVPELGSRRDRRRGSLPGARSRQGRRGAGPVSPGDREPLPGRNRRRMAADRSSQRRRQLQRGDLRPLFHPRPGAPPLRRHRPSGKRKPLRSYERSQLLGVSPRSPWPCAGSTLIRLCAAMTR